jgi:drug/metabolite transporter (DMT)-like permease
LLLLPGVFFALDIGVWHLSFEYISVANATFLANLAIPLATAYGVFVLKERHSIGFLFGLALSMTGMALLVGRDMLHSEQSLIGDLMGLWAACVYTGYLLITRRLGQSYPASRIMTLTSLLSSTLLALMTAALPGRFLPTDPTVWWLLVGLGLFSQTMGQGLITFALPRLPVGLSSVTLFLQPCFSAILGYFILGQHLGVADILSGVLILGGVYCAKTATQAGQPAAAPLQPTATSLGT